MTQRALSVLVAALLITAGQLTLSCPPDLCAVPQDRSCCHSDGLARPDCCPPAQQVVSSPATERGGDQHWCLPLLARPFRPDVSPSANAAATRRDGAPPHPTLLSQRTSLVL